MYIPSHGMGYRKYVVSDDSMSEERILKGDVAIIEEREKVEFGELALVEVAEGHLKLQKVTLAIDLGLKVIGVVKEVKFRV